MSGLRAERFRRGEKVPAARPRWRPDPARPYVGGMPSRSESDFVAVQAALAGEYSLDRELGRGGMGVVYLAREVRLARPVAIKVLPPELAGRAALRDAFLREAQTAARLNHPHIVPVYAAGERAGFAYIVMAFVEGITLGERIRTRGPLLPGQAARLLREVAWALSYAHAAGIVHGDVSAENILLERGTDRAIVMDFGLANAMQTSALGDDGRVMGNAHYVSPEQAVGDPLDARSDLYSLGVCGFYALTGRLPFDAESAGEVVTQHLTLPAPPIAAVAPAVPARLAQAVDKCLAKEPLRRYRSAGSFAEAIDLAFEHAREIPAPLRVWINQGEKEAAPRAIFVMWGSMLGTAMIVGGAPLALFPIPVVLSTVLSYVPMLSRLRRIVKEGYDADDLASALRENDLLRSEELEYERSHVSPRHGRGLRVVFGTSLGALAMFAYLGLSAPTHYGAAGLPETEIFFGLGAFMSSVALTVSGVGLGAHFVRFRLSAWSSSLKIRFWKGTWGRRLARLAGVGLAPPERPAIGMPMLTEVALGRATDHLFQALPRAVRRELSALPATVRRLEDDATKLRQAIDALDDQIAVFGRDAAGEKRSTLHETLAASADYATQRSRVELELTEARTLAAERLAATVAALEGIRLDLLRLRMGDAGIDSVTSSLEAARQLGEQIGGAVAARDEVERLLAPAGDELGAGRAPRADGGGERSRGPDTPVGGVPAPAARG